MLFAALQRKLLLKEYLYQMHLHRYGPGLNCVRAQLVDFGKDSACLVNWQGFTVVWSFDLAHLHPPASLEMRIKKGGLQDPVSANVENFVRISNNRNREHSMCFSSSKMISSLAVGFLMLSGNGLFAQNVDHDMNTDVDTNAARKAEDQILPGDRDNRDSDYNRSSNTGEVRNKTSKRSDNSQSNSGQNQQFQFEQPAPTNTQGAQNNSNRGINSRSRRAYDDRFETPPTPPNESDFAEKGDARSGNSIRNTNDDRGRNNRRFSSQPNDQYDRRNDQGDQKDQLGASLTTNDSDQLVVQQLHSNGLLSSANLRQGDVIVSVNNQPVHSQQSLWRQIRAYNGGGPIPLLVMRNGTRQTIYVQDNDATDDIPREYAWDDQESAWLGVYLNARYQNSAVVQAVQQGSAADKAGLRPNDWIVSVNGQRIVSPAHLSQVVHNMEPGAQINLEVSRRVMGQLQAKLTDHPAFNNVSRDTPRRPERSVNYQEEQYQDEQ